jgi:8-oxo-dGTP pyrophosphatase MutT (NUDIX family)
MHFEEVVARLATLPAALPEPPSELNPLVLGPGDGAAHRGPVVSRGSADSRPVDLSGESPGARPNPTAVPVDARIPWPPGPRRRAAALVLLYPSANREAHIVLIERPHGDLRHPGEISFPGGEIEASDPSVEAAALREAHEEVGLDPQQAGVRILGRLDVVEIRASGFELVPVLAFAERRPAFRPDSHEVERVLEVPLRHFVAGAPIEIVDDVRHGWRMRYGVFAADGLRIWGATARVLGQLGALLGQDPEGA